MNKKIESFDVVGLSVRTNNSDVEKLNADMSDLWHRFMSSGVFNVIANKLENSIYCVYTDYESDHHGDYTAILGCKVEDLNGLPDGLVGKHITGGDYKLYTAKGNLNEGVIYKEWKQIWSSDIARAYSADFEVYTEKSHDRLNAEVDIFVAVR